MAQDRDTGAQGIQGQVWIHNRLQGRAVSQRNTGFIEEYVIKDSMGYKKRKRYIINRRLQIGLFLKWIIIPVVVISASLYYFRGNIYIFILAIVAVLLFSWRILILSHRLAGPIYRLERDLKDIAKGNFSIRIKFRKKDELKSIAEGINSILDEIEKRIVHKQEA